MNKATTDNEWKATACGICYSNCGILVQTGGEDRRHIVRVKGDKNHPASKGYTCNKCLRLDYYQNGKDRITEPLRRKPGGSFEVISWDTAISEVANKMMAIRDTHGGDKIFRFGGGGQGNHLGGAHFGPVAKALGIKYKTNALAQEKTGLAWVQGRMFGANVHGELEHADTLFIVGKNPWQSNGIQRARVLLRQASKDPNRTLIVVDPRRTESAEFADIHLAVKPGRDAWLLSAMVAHIIQEDLMSHNWLEGHTTGVAAVKERFGDIDVDAYAEFSGIKPEDAKAAARAIATADKTAYYEDLGIQMAPHSTLASYLNQLLVTLTGHFGREGTTAVLSQLPGEFFSMSDVGKSNEQGYETTYKTTPVTGARIVAGLIPCNSVPDEILTDHPDRFRAMWIESSNPLHSMADSAKWREALKALDLVVVIEVAMTETARAADYIFPAPSQYEKLEATFFNFEFPANVHHLRQPLFAPLGNTLSEPEVHARMVEAIAPFDFDRLNPLKEAANKGLNAYGMAAFQFMAENPDLVPYMIYILYRTLGPTLGKGKEAGAIYYGMAQRYAAMNSAAVKRAGIEGHGLALGNALLKKIIEGTSGTVFSVSDVSESFKKLGHRDKKIHLAIGELLDEVSGLADLDDLVQLDKSFPFILAAGERRAFTGNTLLRDPSWAKDKNTTALTMHPADAKRLSISDGDDVKLVTRSGEAKTAVNLDDRLRTGTLSIPNGFGLIYPNEQGEDIVTGVAPNELTALENKDKFFGTPFHKFVPARVERI